MKPFHRPRSQYSVVAARQLRPANKSPIRLNLRPRGVGVLILIRFIRRICFSAKQRMKKLRLAAKTHP